LCSLSEVENLTIVAPAQQCAISPAIANNEKVVCYSLKGFKRPLHLTRLLWKLTRLNDKGYKFIFFMFPVGATFFTIPVGQLSPIFLLAKLRLLRHATIVLVLYDFTAYHPYADAGLHKKRVRHKAVMDSYKKFFLDVPKKYVAVSHATKNDAIKFWNVDPNKIDVVHLASFLEPTAPRSNFGSGKILIVGNIEPRKNHIRLLKAYEKVYQKLPLSELIIVGQPLARNVSFTPYVEEVAAAIRKLKSRHKSIKITSLGYVSDENVAKLYNEADVFVYPSLYEGFGLPVLEAMATGCPVVTSNDSSLPEVSGDAAILVDPYNVDELADALITVLSNAQLKREMSKKGVEQAQKFSWKAATDEVLKALK
jgi:glycosyltransferase involved in cell wall biosynthesis